MRLNLIDAAQLLVGQIPLGNRFLYRILPGSIIAAPIDPEGFEARSLCTEKYDRLYDYYLRSKAECPRNLGGK